MRLGLSSWACAWSIGVTGHVPSTPLDAPGLIRLASKLGLGLVQLADNLPVPDYDAIRRVALEHNVSIELGTRGIALDHLRRQIDLCRFLNSRFLRTVVDTPGFEPSPNEVAAAIRAILPELRAAGVTLGIENHDRFSASTFACIIEAIADPAVGICLDTVNSFAALEGPQVVVDILARHVVNLHVKDFVIRRASHMMGFTITGAPAGEGRLDIPWLLSALKNAGRDPNAIIEHWPEPEANLANTIAKEQLWCQSSARYLRTLISL